MNRLLKEQAEIEKKLGIPERIHLAGSPNFGKGAGGGSTSGKKTGLEKTQEDADKTRDSVDRLGVSMERTSYTAQRVGGIFGDSFADAVLSARKFEDVLRDIGKALIRLAAEKVIADQIANGLNSIIGAFTPGTNAYTARQYGTKPGTQQTAILQAQDAAFRAAGGPLRAGQLAVVGERGPELFVPGRSGSVIPNNGLVTQNITVNAQGADHSVVPRLKQAVSEAAQAGYALVMADLQRGGPIRRMV